MCCFTVSRQEQYAQWDPDTPHLFVPAESDARYGGFDFRAAHEEAAPDLQALLDNHESLAFRRRGYERDALLRAVVDRARFTDLLEMSEEQRERRKAELARRLRVGELTSSPSQLR